MDAANQFSYLFQSPLFHCCHSPAFSIRPFTYPYPRSLIGRIHSVPGRWQLSLVVAVVKSGRKGKMMLANPTRQMFAQQTTAEKDGAGIDHHHHPLLNTQRPRPQRKRKAEIQPENNERLSKRMSLLNLGMPPSFYRLITSSSTSPPYPPRTHAQRIASHHSSLTRTSSRTRRHKVIRPRREPRHGKPTTNPLRLQSNILPPTPPR